MSETKTVSRIDCSQSSNISWARYDEATQRLEIDFKNSKGEKVSTYEYADFPPEEWDAFRASESRGKHFAYRIRPRLKGVKLEAA